VARCTVERLMRSAGRVGARQGRRTVTTRPDPAAARHRTRWNGASPRRHPTGHGLDFTYVPTWSGTAFTAFVTDVHSRRIVGWRTATWMPTALLSALWRWPCGPVPGRAPSTGCAPLRRRRSVRYAERLLEASALASIGSVGDS
jgi:putative transposase